MRRLPLLWLTKGNLSNLYWLVEKHEITIQNLQMLRVWKQVLIRVKKKTVSLKEKSSLSISYIFLPFTSNTVNAKLGEKYRRIYWAEVSMKKFSISSVVVAKKGRTNKSLFLNSDNTIVSKCCSKVNVLSFSAHSCRVRSCHPLASFFVSTSLLLCSTVEKHQHTFDFLSLVEL